VETGANETIFEFPSSTRLYLLPIAIVCCAAIVLAIHAPSLNSLAVAVFMSLVGTEQLISFSRLRYRVAVSDDGIRYMPYGDAPIFFQWSEVAGLELRERRFIGRLVICDAPRLRKMVIDYRLGKFQDLLSIVVDRADNCDPHTPLPATFHTSYLDQAVAVIVFSASIVLSIYFAHLNQPAYVAFGLFALVPIGVLVVFPQSLTVSTNSLELAYLGRKREIALATVTGLRFGILRGGRGSLWAEVWLDTTENKPLKLTGFTEGSLAVYYALRDACRPMNKSARPSF
jgi:hypothetical protein